MEMIVHNEDPGKRKGRLHVETMRGKYRDNGKENKDANGKENKDAISRNEGMRLIE